jgi:predicted dehydrogenase
VVRFGVIGIGKHAEWAVMPAIAERSAPCELKAVADISPERLATADRYAGVAQFADYREMIAQGDLDAVYVCTTVERHLDPTLAALEAGLHVVCEKPLAESALDCRKMTDAAERAERLLAVTFENRYQPHAGTIRRWVREGHLGTIEAVHAKHFWDGHKTRGPLSERRRRAIDLNGGLDCGIHTVDLVRYFVGGGRWGEIAAIGAWFGEKVHMPPHISILTGLDTVPVVGISVSMGYAAQIEARTSSSGLTIVGDRGVIDEVTGTDGKVEVRLTSETLCETCPVLHKGHAETIGWMLDDFADVVEGREQSSDRLATGEDGLIAQQLVEVANAQAVARR